MAAKLDNNDLNAVSGGIEYRHYERSPYSYLIKFKYISTNLEDFIEGGGTIESVVTAEYMAKIEELQGNPDISITYASGIIGGKNII